MQFLRLFLFGGVLVECVSFTRVMILDEPIYNVAPHFLSLKNSLDPNAVQILTRVYALYIMTLALIRLCICFEMKNTNLFRCLVFTHICEFVAISAELFYYQKIPFHWKILSTEPHLSTTTAIVAIVFAQTLWICVGYFTYTSSVSPVKQKKN